MLIGLDGQLAADKWYFVIAPADEPTAEKFPLAAKRAIADAETARRVEHYSPTSVAGCAVRSYMRFFVVTQSISRSRWSRQYESPSE